MLHAAVEISLSRAAGGPVQPFVVVFEQPETAWKLE